jgi:hypothetical protein
MIDEDPDSPFGKIIYENNRFISYQGGENIQDILSGKHLYDATTFIGQGSAYQLSRVKGFWNDFKIGTIGAGYFPSYTVRVVEDKDEYELDMNNDFNTTAKTFTVRLTPSAFPDPGNAAKQNQARLQLCRFDALGKFYDSSIELNPGKNVIGLLVEGKIDEKWYWAGFNWVTVNRKEADSSTTTTTVEATTSSSSSTTIPSNTTTTTIAPDQRFMDNGDGTVTDKRTGLIWLKNASIGGWQMWYEAETYCTNLASGQAGLTDSSVAGQWRLPSKEELQGIGTDPPTTWDTGNPPVTWTTPPDAPFTPVQHRAYWSDTIYDPNPDYAWTVNMKDGSVLNYAKSSGSPSVWPVRDGN